jgi:cyclophilin family peptidyl-prolyl cis-trans isomerase
LHAFNGKRLLLVAGLLGLLLLALAACSAPPATTTDSSATATIAPTAAPAPTAVPVVDTPLAVSESTSPTVSLPTLDLGPKPVMPKAGERPLAEAAPQQRANMYKEAPDQVIDPSKVYVATITTSKGDIVVELYAEQAPTAVNNFVVLSELGYYDGLALHPAGPPQAILSGDPSETGQGGPGYEILGERTIPVIAGTLGYLRLPEQVNPEGLSNGSQFFLTMEDVPDISGVFSAFGQVIEGLDVAAQIAEGDTIEQIVITEAAASKAPTPAPLPTATTVPTPFAPEQSKTGDRPLAKMPAEQRNGMFNAEPAMQLEAGKDYSARITTDVGDIVVDLYEDQTPITVNNFVTLANQGFYDNTSFHRVIEGFMAQAGDPTGTGSGGPGYQFADEIVPELTFDGAGVLAMANAGPNTNGSQFFITYDKTDWLNGLHTIFGKVTEGEDVLKKIKVRDPQTATEPGTMIEKITIETK